jgi:hypothetical protein
MRFARAMTTLVVALTGVLLLSCGFSKAVRQAAEQQRRQNDLMQIGLAYHNYVDTNSKAPTKADDLTPFLFGSAEPVAMLTDGRVVFIYGVTIKDMEKQQGTMNTVIAYESKVPNEGGLVIMGDASVRNVTATEFKGMTLAKAAPPDEKKEDKTKPTSKDEKKDDKTKKDSKKL